MKRFVTYELIDLELSLNALPFQIKDFFFIFSQPILPIPPFSPFLPPHPSHPLRSPPFAQSILAIPRFSSKIAQISNAIASTSFPKPVPTSLSQSILPITTAQRTENLVFRASAQSILPQTTAHPCKPVDPRQNALFSAITPFSQPSLTKTAVRPFCPVQPRSSRPSLPLPFQASISCPGCP